MKHHSPVHLYHSDTNFPGTYEDLAKLLRKMKSMLMEEYQPSGFYSVINHQFKLLCVSIWRTERGAIIKSNTSSIITPLHMDFG